MAKEQDGNTSPPSLIFRRSLGGLGLASLLSLAAFLSWHSLTDLDIWFHLRAGRDILAGGGFPQVNTYAFTDPLHSWLNHEWLYQVIVAWTAPSSPLVNEAATGWNILRSVLILALVATILLGDGMLKRLLKGDSQWPILTTCFASLCGLLVIWPRFNLRPELLSYLFFVLLVRRADQFYRQPEPKSLRHNKSLWQMVAIVVLWAQIHGFAALGPVILVLALAFRSLDRQFNRSTSPFPAWRPASLWAPVGLLLMALVLTPNHWRGLVFPFRALTQLSTDTADLSGTVSELVPLLATQNSLGLTLVAFQVSLVWSVLFAILSWGRVSFFRIFLVGATALAALANQRNIALYGLAFILMHSGCGEIWLAERWQRLLKVPTALRSFRMPAAIILTLLVMTGAGWWIKTLTTNDFYLREGVGRRFGNQSTPATYPRAAARALPLSQSERTFANLDAAAFLLGTTPSRLYIDGRTEAYPKSRWAQYNKLRSGGAQALNHLAREEVSAILLATSSGAFSTLATDLLTSPAWRATAAGPGGILFLPQFGTSVTASSNILKTAADAIISGKLDDKTRRADFCLAAADLYQAANDQPGAKRALETGLRARPDHPNLNHNRGNQLLAAGDFSEALAHFQRALAINGRLAGSALNAGVCQLRLGQPEAAATSFRRSLRINSNQVGGWVNLAVSLRNAGLYDEAVSALEKALALRPDDTRLQGQLQEWQRGSR